MNKGGLPKDVRQQFKVVQDFIKQRDVDAARSQLLEIEMGSSFMLFHRMMAACAFIDKDYDLASSHIEQAIALKPEKQVLIADAIRIYKIKKDDQRTRELFQSFNISHSNSSSELLRVALAMKSLGQFQGAASVLEKALRLSPENDRIRNHYGILLALQDRISDALQQWSFSLRYNPHSVQAMVCLGRLSMHLNENLKAIEYFKETMDLASAPDDSRRLDLAEAYVRASSVNEARELLSSVESLESNPRLHYIWGLLHSQVSDYFLAYSSFNRCIELGRERGNDVMKQLDWPNHFSTDDAMRQVLKEVRPTLESLFDPLGLLKLTEHELEPHGGDIFSDRNEAF